MKKNLLISLLITLIFSVNFLHAQVSINGTPPSFNNQNLQSIKVPTENMPAIDVNALKAEDIINDQEKGQIWRFGENILYDINPQDNGVWNILPNGDKVWRVNIESSGALTINLTFDKYKLPPGAELYIYNEDHSEIIGAFTDYNNQADGFFATTLIQGEIITVEYYEPNSVPFTGEINIYRVTHGYRGPGEYAAKAFGNSGSCNVNVICPLATGWEEEIRSTVMLVSGGSGFCTGALVNNTSEDGTPYILSADHCYSTPGSVVYWFNWQSTTCANPGSSPSYDAVSGAQDRARNADSDFWLVELNSTPPAAYNVFYAGWDNSDATPTSTVGIHHPSGDIKKFSNDHDASVSDQYLGTSGINDSHWKIVMWDDATTTEGGSSGSPLFDQNHRIVGQLHGGYASCTSLTSDWYGKFSMSWDRGTTNATQLEHWLDPTTTGTTTQNGYDPNSPSSAIDVQMLQIDEPQINYCSNPGSITPEVTIKNKGTTTITSVDLAYVLDGGTPVTTSWNGTLATNGTTNVTFPAITLSTGAHTFEAYTYNPNSSVDQDLTNDTLSMSTNIGGTYTTPFFEDFESGTFPPDCWESYLGTNGLGTGYNWTTTTTAYTGVIAAYVRDENVTGGDAEDWLVTPLIDMSSTINNELTFYERQQYGNDYNTDFYIKVSTTSQTSVATFTDVITYGETSFSTTYTKRTVDLSAYDGQSVYVAFVMIQDDGDRWYVDSVYINGTIPAGAPDAEFSASTLTACPNTAITFTDATTNTPTSWAWTFTPSTVTYVGGTNASSQNPQVEFNAAGTYTVNLAATNAVITNNENKINYITINPIATASFTYVDGPGTQVTFTDVSTNATSWAWDFGDGNTSSQQSPTHTYATSGSYTACLIATNACGSDTICQSVSIVSTGINTEDAQINVYPNPSNGRFILSMNTNGEEILLNVYNSTGQLVYTDRIAASQGEISYVINLSNLSAGVYILELNSETIHYIDRLLYK